MKEKQPIVDFDLNNHIVSLLISEPFFAALSRQITKTKNYSIPTAGVTINPNTSQFELIYNPNFMSGLTNKQLVGVIKHEYYHLLLEHVTTRKPTNIKDAKIWNIACDLAINSFLGKDNLPIRCCIPSEKPFEKFPLYQSSEWYFEELKKLRNGQQSENNESDNNGDGQFDDHEGWSTSDKQISQQGVAKERIRQIVKKAIDEVTQSGNNWGTISEEIKKQILKLVDGTLDWKKVLRYFIKTSQRAEKNNSIRKINKRYPYIHSGKKINRQSNIAISIDQSGSVSNELLASFFSELNKLSTIATFTVIPFDHEIAKEKIYIWKKGERKNVERVLQGGTNFDAPTDYVNNDSKFDGHIILTDMQAPMPKTSKCQRMWLTNEQNAKQPYFATNERIVVIKDVA